MSIAPIAAQDIFTMSQGQTQTTLAGNLGADNGAGVDHDPDGTVLGWVAGIGFSAVGDGDRYLGAFFSQGTLAFLHIMGTVSYPFPVILTSSGTTTAEGGTVWLDTSGNFTYTSALGFTGVDSFSYTLVDSDFNVTTTTVTLHVDGVTGANDRPVAMDDVFQVNEDTGLSGNVLADNGHGADSDPDGDALHVLNQTVYTAAGGIVQILADGSLTYTARAGYSGSDGFDYTLLDPSGAKDIGHVSLTVLAMNDAPVAVDDQFQVIHDRAFGGNVLNDSGTDLDQDGEVLSVVAAQFTTAAGGLVTLMADGTFAYMPADGFVGPDGFDYTAQDPHGATDTGHVTLTVVNHATTTETDRFSVAYRGNLSGNLMASNGFGPDSDADGDAIGVAAGRYVSDMGSVLTVAADGHFTFKGGDLSYGLEGMNYTLVDGLGTSTIGQIQINVADHGGHQGSALSERWTGSTNRDVIMMAGGDDKVDGSDGADVIGGGSGDDSLFGGNGNDRIYGEADKDDLFGGLGADRLDGGTGRDRLKGGGGADVFVLSDLGLGDTDRIADFGVGDRLQFQALDLGLTAVTAPDASWLVVKGAADGSQGRFVYDSGTRTLWWDDDGLAATAGQFLVSFDAKVALTYDNILLA